MRFLLHIFNSEISGEHRDEMFLICSKHKKADTNPLRMFRVYLLNYEKSIYLINYLLFKLFISVYINNIMSKDYVK